MGAAQPRGVPLAAVYSRFQPACQLACETLILSIIVFAGCATPRPQTARLRLTKLPVHRDTNDSAATDALSA
jgi:hypothetical protein